MGQRARRPLGRGTWWALALLVASLLGPLAVQAAPARPAPGEIEWGAQWSPPTTVYIPASGQHLNGGFLDFWRTNGGAELFGNPVTQEQWVDGRLVQYFDYARFESWPEDANGVNVRLGAIGEALRPPAVLRAASGSGETAAAAMGVMLAWLPVDADAIAAAESADVVYVAATGHTVAHGFKDLWQRLGGATFLGNPLSEAYAAHGATWQVFERGQMVWRPGEDPQLVPLGRPLAEQIGLSTAPVDSWGAPAYSPDLFVAPEKWIQIFISTQYMIVWEGDTPVAQLYVSTGRPGFDTPLGTFYVNTKVPIQDMSGNINGESYYVKDVTSVMYFTDVGHAFHAAYWHDNWGQVMSHGCINMPVDFAAWLYDWTPLGTRIEIVW
jgi:hypothetical protein